MQRISPLLRHTSAALVLSILTACGSGDGAPHNSSINFSPNTVNQLTIAGVFGFSNIQYVNVTLLTGGDQPLTSTGFLLSVAGGVQAYEGELSVGELAAATPIATPTMVTTDTFGSKILTLVYPVDPADGTFTLMEAWSGTAYQKWDVTFECQDPDGAGVGADCPGA